MTWSALMTRLARAGSPRNRHCWTVARRGISRRSSGGHSKPNATTTSPLTGGITRSRTGWPGTVLRVRITTGEVTVFDGDQIVCTHRRMTGRKGQYATNGGEHVRPQHRVSDALWSRRWFTDRATSYGPATVTVIEKILDRRHVIEAQGYLDCQNILSTLGKKGLELLEAACQDLLQPGGYPSYTTVKRAMASIPRRCRSVQQSHALAVAICAYCCAT